MWKKVTPLILFMTLLSIHGSFAQPDAGIEGVWEGQLKVGPTSLRLVFHFTKADDGYSGTIDSPDQGAEGIPLGSVTLKGDRVEATVPSIRGVFSGTRSADGASLEGTWRQGASEFPLRLTRRTGEAPPLPPAPGPDVDVAGDWLGTLAVGSVELRIVFHFTKADDGALHGTMDSPDQGAEGIPLGRIEGEGMKLRVEIPAVGGAYEGVIDADGARIEGTWSQGGQTFPLTLVPVREGEKIEKPKRPQEPERPLPYREEEVRFRNEDAGITLAGTLTLPEGEGPFPAAALISGSGPQDRDEALLGHRPFLVLSDYLTRHGIAVLRFDDRGVGASEGDFASATSADFATDVAAAVDFLEARSGIDAGKVGLIGHSEGGLIAPMVAAERPDVAFIVLMAGPGITGRRILELQSVLIARADGTDEDVIAWNSRVQKLIFDIVKTTPDDEEAAARIRKAWEAELGRLSDAEKQKYKVDEVDIEAQIRQVLSPWFRFFLTYDPAPALRKVRCPVLAINGEKDLQVPSKENLSAIEEALKAGGNTRYEVVEMPGLNHLFQPAETGAISEYAKIEVTIAPEALERITRWILAQTGR
ncbi:alpha/beta hydrolase family protein [Rhodocaloribacter sp.]